MNWLGNELNIKSMEDWYKVSYRDIRQNYGGSLIENNESSHIKLITTTFPNYNWLPWKFNHTPKGFWSDRNNIKEYMNWLGQKLNIKSMEDWYKVSSKVKLLSKLKIKKK